MVSNMEVGEDTILDSPDMKKLFVNKIPLDVTDEELQSFIEGVCGGTITETSIVRKEGAKSYHFGYVTLESSHLVDEVIYNEKTLVLNGTTLEVNRAPPKKENQSWGYHKTKKLFVAGIPKTGLTEDELKQYFDERHDVKYGTVESVQFIKKKDEEGNQLEENKGFGFVVVSSEHLADTISMQHATIEINGVKIEVKKSDRDGGRGGQRGRGRGHYGYGGYGGYGGYNQGWGGYAGYGYGSYGIYPQYGVSSAVRGGARGGGKDGARGGGRGKRATPYAKKTS